MKWLTLELAKDVFIPLGTFALGILVTIWTKRRDAQKTDRRAHAAEAAVLLSAWYNQIHDLSIDLRYKLTGRARKRAIATYVGSRHVLQKLLQLRDILAKAGNQPEMVSEIDGFLNAVTYIDLDGSNPECDPSTSFCKDFSEVLRLQAGDKLLRDLDKRVQRVSRLAARVLA